MDKGKQECGQVWESPLFALLFLALVLGGNYRVVGVEIWCCFLAAESVLGQDGELTLSNPLLCLHLSIPTLSLFILPHLVYPFLPLQSIHPSTLSLYIPLSSVYLSIPSHCLHPFSSVYPLL